MTTSNQSCQANESASNNNNDDDVVVGKKDSSIHIPPSIVAAHILPFLERETYDSCITSCKEVWHASKVVSLPPWPKLCKTYKSGISAIAFAPSGKAFACGQDDGSICLWTVSGQQRTLQNHQSKILTLEFSPNEDCLASGSVDCSICIWPLQNLLPTPSALLLLTGHCQPVHSLSFFPDGTLASACHDKSIRLWDTKTGECKIRRLEDTESIESISVTSSGNLLSTASWDGTIRVWEVDQKKELRRCRTMEEKALPRTKVQFSRDGQCLYGIKGFRVRQWNMNDDSLTFLSGDRVHRTYSTTISP